MAQIDSSIYFQQQAPDISGNLERGMNMRQMVDQRTKQRGIEDAYKNSVVVNPDGSTSLDGKKAMSQLLKIDPKEALSLKERLASEDLNNVKAHSEKITQLANYMSNALNSAKDQDSYQAVIADAKQRGYDVSTYPAQWGPDAQKKLHFDAGMALTAKERMDQANKDRDFNQKDRELGLKHDENNIKRVEVRGAQADKLIKDMKNDLDADRGRSGNFGQISAKVQQAERLQTLVDSYKNGDLPPQQMEELALGMANMLAGSTGASRAQVEALVPHTWWGGKQSAQQWLMNEPTGAGQQKFVESMAHTIQREKDTANDQLNNIRASRLAAHEQAKKTAPDQYNNLLQGYGIDPTKIQGGKYKKDVGPAMVLMKDPQGNIRQVSADAVGAAKKAGGTIVEQQVAGGKQ